MMTKSDQRYIKTKLLNNKVFVMGRRLEKYYLFYNTAFLSLFTIKFVRYMYMRQHTL